MQKKKPHLFIGCSGWNYDHWKGAFYPESISSREEFSRYTLHFSTVEVNNTFYNLPDASVFKNWEKEAPKGFIYAVKANRFITHMKKLKNPKLPVRKFLTRARMLKKHLGPVLFQLPPRWKVNTERLDEFTDILPEDLEYVFEFRDPSWYSDEVYKILEGKKMSMCLHDMKGSVSPEISVGPLSYIRFHGATELYGGKYPLKKLKKWAIFIRKEMKKGKKVYAYFNNDAEANAPKDALKLRKELE